MPEWLKGVDCKSIGYAYEGSNPSPSIGQYILNVIGKLESLARGSSSVGRASAFQAEGRGFEPRLPLGCRLGGDRACIAQQVEHFLGKEEVTGSSPVAGLRMGALTARWARFILFGGSVVARVLLL